MENKDKNSVAYGQRGTRYSIVLVEGNSDKNGNVDVGQMLADSIAEFALREFEGIIEAIRHKEKGMAKRIFLSDQRKLIYRLAEAEELENEDLRYTFMCICIDVEKKQFCGLHLGDGIIGMYKDNSFEIISVPANGLYKNPKFITTEGAEKGMKMFYSNVDDSVWNIVLASEKAIRESSYDLKNIEKTISTLLKNRYEKSKDIIMLNRRKQKWEILKQTL